MNINILINLLKKKWTMSYVCIRSKHISHFDDRNLLTILTKVNSTLTACKSATHNYYVIANLFFFLIIIINYNNIVSIKTWDWWNKRSRTYCDNNCISIFLLSIFLCNFCIKSDFNTSISSKLLVCTCKLIHFIFK